MMVCLTKQSHPLTAYLSRHEWEWLPESVVIRESGCTPDDLETYCNRYWSKCVIDRRNGEIRYTSNNSSYKRRIVETLKKAYPSWLYTGELQRKANVSTNPGRLINRYMDLLPVERDSVYDRINKTYVWRYRYIPNDKRSLVEKIMIDAEKQKRRADQQDTVLAFLQNHQGEWFTAAEISNYTTIPTSNQVAQALLSIRRRNPHIKHRGHSKSHGYYYSYTPTTTEVIA